MKNKFITLFTALLIGIVAHSQNDCGAIKIEVPQLKGAELFAYQKMISDFKTRMQNDDTLSISNVVHVWHKSWDSIPENWVTSDEQIYSQFRMTNGIFHGDTNYVRAGSATIPVNMIMAPEDPDGNITTGIVHHVNGQDFFYESFDSLGWTIQHFADLDGNDTLEYYSFDEVCIPYQWNPQKYFNHHLAAEMNNNNGGSGIQAYAYFTVQLDSNSSAAPFSTDYDRNVSLENNFGDWTLFQNTIKAWDASYTSAHEVGHSLSLFHASGSCDYEVNCYTEGDRCCDTDPDPLTASFCETANPCGGGNTIGNIMAYWRSSDVDVHCKNHFTQDQAHRMMQGLAFRQGQTGGQNIPPPPNECDNTEAPDNLFRETFNNGWVLLWSNWQGWLYYDSVQYVKRCQIVGNKVGSPHQGSYDFIAIPTESGSIQKIISSPTLIEGQEYRWKIRCTCVDSPDEEAIANATPFSEYHYFTHQVPQSPLEATEEIVAANIDNGSKYLFEPKVLDLVKYETNLPDGIYNLLGQRVENPVIGVLYVIVENHMPRKEIYRQK